MADQAMYLFLLFELALITFFKFMLDSDVLLFLHILAVLAHRLQLRKLLLVRFQGQEGLVTPILEILGIPHDLQLLRLSHSVNLLHLLQQIVISILQLSVFIGDSLQPMQLKLGLLEQVPSHHSFLVQSLLLPEVFIFKHLDTVG